MAGTDNLTHEQLVPVHNEMFIQITKRLEDLEESDYSNASDLSSIKTSIEFIHQRLDKREEQTAAILELGYSVRSMVDEVKILSEKMEKIATSLGDHEVRISGIEKEDIKDEIQFIKDELILIKNRPANTIMKYVDVILKGGLLAAFLGFLYWLTGGKIGGN